MMCSKLGILPCDMAWVVVVVVAVGVSTGGMLVAVSEGNTVAVAVCTGELPGAVSDGNAVAVAVSTGELVAVGSMVGVACIWLLADCIGPQLANTRQSVARIGIIFFIGLCILPLLR
jgi:hypothetical protein